MSGENVNPFADPNQEVNPFSNPPVVEAAKPDDYNPFAQQQQQQAPPQNAYTPKTYSATPATIEPTRSEPAPFQNNYGGGNYSAPDDNMRARQEELERKAADLEKREQELKKVQREGGLKENNFPPLPSFCCVGPCYYHDITVDIPMESQKTCKMMFIVWQFYVFCLFFNCITGLAALCVGLSNGAELFGVGILYLVIFTPCSFVFWYRPLYKALRSGSSFNYMLFFFIFFFQTALCVLYCLGISFLGTCGWINGASAASTGREGVAAMFFISGALFSILAIFMVLLLRKVHTSYRRSGASIEKAQSEFTQGIASNKNVQNAAAEAVKASVSDGTRY